MAKIHSINATLKDEIALCDLISPQAKFRHYPRELVDCASDAWKRQAKEVEDKQNPSPRQKTLSAQVSVYWQSRHSNSFHHLWNIHGGKTGHDAMTIRQNFMRKTSFPCSRSLPLWPSWSERKMVSPIMARIIFYNFFQHFSRNKLNTLDREMNLAGKLLSTFKRITLLKRSVAGNIP